MSREISRKELFRELFRFARDSREHLEGAPRLDPATLLRPPGAAFPEESYLRACTGCEACVKACPKDAIFMVAHPRDDARRIAAIAPERRPCVLCDGLPCIASCTDRALLPVPSPRQVRIGVAQVDPRLCRTFRGEACDLCIRFCPYPNAAIRAVGGRPIVTAEVCTGCGLCESACPERPRAIWVVPERELIPGVRLPKVFPPPLRR